MCKSQVLKAPLSYLKSITALNASTYKILTSILSTGYEGNIESPVTRYTCKFYSL